MSDIRITHLPAVRLAELAVHLDSLDQSRIGPALGPLYDRLVGALVGAGIEPAGPSIAYYVMDFERKTIDVHAGFPVTADVVAADGWEVVELPAVEQAAALVHHGAVDAIGERWGELLGWVARRDDIRLTGWGREVYLQAPPDDPEGWVTELQHPVETV